MWGCIFVRGWLHSYHTEKACRGHLQNAVLYAAHTGTGSQHLNTKEHFLCMLNILFVHQQASLKVVSRELVLPLEGSVSARWWFLAKKKGRIGIFLTALQLCLWLRGDTPPWGSLCFSVLCLPTIRVFFRTQNLACSTLERTQILESFSWC